MKSMRSEKGRWPTRLLAGSVLASPGRRMALLQFALYVVVGGICFSIDIAGFVVLRSFGLPILTASAISFVTSTVVNYLLCCALVFRRGRFSRGEELLRLFAIAIGGLSLNSTALWVLAEILMIDPTLAKIIAVLPVIAWNYLGRRLIVFDSTPSAAMLILAERAREKF